MNTQNNKQYFFVTPVGQIQRLGQALITINRELSIIHDILADILESHKFTQEDITHYKKNLLKESNEKTDLD